MLYLVYKFYRVAIYEPLRDNVGMRWALGILGCAAVGYLAWAVVVAPSAEGAVGRTSATMMPSPVITESAPPTPTPTVQPTATPRPTPSMPTEFAAGVCSALDAAVERDAIFAALLAAYEAGDVATYDATRDQLDVWSDHVHAGIDAAPVWEPGSALKLGLSELNALESFGRVLMNGAMNGDPDAAAELPSLVARVSANQVAVFDQRDRLRDQYGLGC